MKLSHSLAHCSMLALLVILPACSLAINGDVTPPPNSSITTLPVNPTSSGPVYPLLPPDPQQGAALYAVKCAPCHDDKGLGNGVQVSKIPNPVAAIGSPDLARQAIPSVWYTIITQGDQAHFMMPFSSGLTDRQRWDVLAYVDTLSAPASVIAEGRSIYTTQCAACHGEQGKGDGPKAARLSPQPGDFTDQREMAGLSEFNLYQTTSQGKAPNMPAYASQLDDAQLWAVSAYLRTLTFALPAVAAPKATAMPSSPPASSAYPAASTATVYPAPAASAASTPTTTGVTPGSANLGSVSGSVSMASGAPLPAGLTITLVGLDSMQIAYTQKTGVQPDGTYLFENVDMPSGRVFIASTNYQNTTFSSDTAQVQDNRALNLPITIYETMTDKSALVIDSMHVLLDFSQPGIVTVMEIYVISNPTGKMVIAAATGQPVLEFAIPKQAANLQLDEGQLGERYVQTANGIGDTQGIKPGSSQHQVSFAYDLPYTDRLDLSLPVPLPANMALIMLTSSSVKVTSSQLVPAGQQSAQGMVLNLYAASNVAGGTTLQLSLSGKPSAAPQSNALSQNADLLVGGGVFVAVLVLSGLWIYRSRGRRPQLPSVGQPATATAEDVDSLLDAIVALDDLHTAGQIPDSAYQQRRAELKEKLGKAISSQP